MTLRFLLSALVFAGISLYAWHVGASAERRPNAATVRGAPAQPSPPTYVGAGSCAAAACHNGYLPRHQPGDEYSTWMTSDPHARAYEMLFDARSVQIQKNLNRKTAAHEEQRCLKCHVAPDYDVKNPPQAAPYFKTDGVNCESCHGPAKDWLASHHLDAWQAKTAAEKKHLGMNDTQSLLGRARVCVQCHVGAAGMEVDHDLIAAGHPRLNFEYAAFHAHMPRHWPDYKDRDPTRSPLAHADFDARAWMLGQLLTAQASLELLAHRASDANHAWPEFAEFDCAACHHSLQSPSPRQKAGYGKRKPGELPWSAYALPTPHILDALGDGKAKELRDAIGALQASMGIAKGKRETIAQNAAKASRGLKALLDRWDDSNPKQIPLGTLARGMYTLNRLNRADTTTQACLGITSLRLSGPVEAMPPDFRATLKTLRPSPFDPDAVRKRLLELK